MDITLDVAGDVQLHRTLMRWTGKVEDFLPAFAALVTDFREMELRQFDSQGGFGSGGWAPLAVSTIQERTRLGIGGDSPILDRSGAGSYGKSGRVGGTGKASLTTSTSPYSVTHVDADGFFVGSSDPVMGYHQRGHNKLPQRRPVEMREADRIRWVKVLQAWATGTPLDNVLTLTGPLGL